MEIFEDFSYIFIATPETVGLSGDFQDLLNSGALDVAGLNIRLTEFMGGLQDCPFCVRGGVYTAGLYSRKWRGSLAKKNDPFTEMGKCDL